MFTPCVSSTPSSRSYADYIATPTPPPRPAGWVGPPDDDDYVDEMDEINQAEVETASEALNMTAEETLDPNIFGIDIDGDDVVFAGVLPAPSSLPPPPAFPGSLWNAAAEILGRNPSDNEEARATLARLVRANSTIRTFCSVQPTYKQG